MSASRAIRLFISSTFNGRMALSQGFGGNRVNLG